jgi:hypothetical protein
MTTSIAECRAKGMTFEAYEAVSIAQQLITSLGDPRHAVEVRPPYGPPTAENVFLKPDGSVVCRGCSVTPAVSEIAIFLEELVSAGSLRVPGGLRYTIARALLNVDAPPFDSLEEFALDLSRHERGDRAEVVRRALARADDQRATVSLPFVERRKSRSSATTLRRELRDAEVRLYQARAGLIHEPTKVIDLVPAAAAPQQDRTATAAAACLAASLSLIAGGELMFSRRAPGAVPETHPTLVEAPRAPVVPQAAVAGVPPAVSEPPIASLGASLTAVRVSSGPKRTSRPDGRRLSMTPTTHPRATTVRPKAAARRAPRGVLDRLRLGWLRRAFTTHSDL